MRTSLLIYTNLRLTSGISFGSEYVPKVMFTLQIVVVHAMLLRDKCKIPTIRIKICTWDNENVSVAAYMNRISRNGFVAKLE